jgi:hypothetical protein
MVKNVQIHRVRAGKATTTLQYSEGRNHSSTGKAIWVAAVGSTLKKSVGGDLRLPHAVFSTRIPFPICKIMVKEIKTTAYFLAQASPSGLRAWRTQPWRTLPARVHPSGYLPDRLDHWVLVMRISANRGLAAFLDSCTIS